MSEWLDLARERLRNEKEKLTPEEEMLIAEAKAKMTKIFGATVPVSEAFLTVLFADGTERSYDITP
jgi:hypothetical protein